MAGAAGKARVMQIGCFRPEMHLPGDQRMCACGKGGALGLWTQGLSGSSAQPALMSPACSPTSGLSCRSVVLAERSLSTVLTPCTARLAGDGPGWVSPVTPPPDGLCPAPPHTEARLGYLVLLPSPPLAHRQTSVREEPHLP